MLSCCLLLAFAAEAPSLRSLCIDSHTVALATVNDPATPTSFRLTRVLRGSLKPGVVVTPKNLNAAAMRTYDERDLSTGIAPPRRCEQALVFLDKSGNALGLRLLTTDGRTMGLVDGTPVVLPSRWSVLVERARADVATVDRLTAYRNIPLADRRTRAIVAWIERHRDDLCSLPGGDDEAPVGWEGLRVALFDSIYETNDPECAWTAVRLHARLFGGELLKPRNDVFASEAGRALLLKHAADAKSLTGDRVRAVTLLGPCDELLPLLGDKDGHVQAEAARTLGQGKGPKTADALLAAYRTAKPGPVRDELAWALAAIAPAALTGNPAGVCAVMREVEQKIDGLDFWLHLRTGGKTVVEQPVLVLERLNLIGGVAETKRSPLTFTYLPRPWKDGWDGEGPLPATLPFSGLQANTWYRFRVEGTLGPKKEKWQSEPRQFKTGPFVPPAEGGGRRGGIYKY